MKQVKFLLTFLPILFLGVSAFAQKDNIGIGTTKPDQSAVLDISSTNKGLLTPRMTAASRNAIQNPAEGLIVYQIDLLSGFYFYDGKEWKGMTQEKSVAIDPNNWTLAGNDGVSVGTGVSATASSAIATPTNVPINFKIGGIRAGIIDPAGATENLYMGLGSGQANIGGAGFNGYWNVGLGNRSLNVNSTGYNNIAIGIESLFKNTSGRNNTVMGYKAMYNNVSTESNFALGGYALYSMTTSGASNTAIGVNSLYTLNGGSDNIAIGKESMYYNIVGNYNVAIGGSAMASHTGSRNTAIGYQAGFKVGYTPTVAGSGNIFLGYQAGINETTSDKLYISNSNTALPLVYGDFSAKFVSIGDVGVAGDPVATAAKRNSLAAQYGLLVQKGILTEKIKVATMTTTDWADYVFEKDYKRMSLEEVEKFVSENKHLPNVPTTTEMMASGSDLIKTDAKLLEKIEELTLYMIEMNKEIKALKAENAKLKK